MHSEAICRNCRHANTQAMNDRMYRLGFRNCFYLPNWHFVSGINVCRTGRFEALQQAAPQEAK